MGFHVEGESRLVITGGCLTRPWVVYSNLIMASSGTHADEFVNRLRSLRGSAWPFGTVDGAGQYADTSNEALYEESLGKINNPKVCQTEGSNIHHKT